MEPGQHPVDIMDDAGSINAGRRKAKRNYGVYGVVVILAVVGVVCAHFLLHGSDENEKHTVKSTGSDKKPSKVEVRTSSLSASVNSVGETPIPSSPSVGISPIVPPAPIVPPPISPPPPPPVTKLQSISLSCPIEWQQSYSFRLKLELEEKPGAWKERNSEDPTEAAQWLMDAAYADCREYSSTWHKIKSFLGVSKTVLEVLQKGQRKPIPLDMEKPGPDFLDGVAEIVLMLEGKLPSAELMSTGAAIAPAAAAAGMKYLARQKGQGNQVEPEPMQVSAPRRGEQQSMGGLPPGIDINQLMQGMQSGRFASPAMWVAGLFMLAAAFVFYVRRSSPGRTVPTSCRSFDTYTRIE